LKHKIYQIDAFTDEVFSGNPAAVCPLNDWLPDELLQNIAKENNLAETAFYVKGSFSSPLGGSRREGAKLGEGAYQIRWFTPKVEVDLCGHATLAAAYVLFNYEKHQENIISFYSPRSGELTVTKQKEFLTLNFPTDVFEKIELSKELTSGFNILPKLALKGKTDYVLVFENEGQIKNIKPNLSQIAKLPGRGVIITAKGNQVDFVSRFFAPQSGIDEDPVTGSAHTTLTPYWAKKFGMTELTAIQLSERKGYLQCKLLGDRVEISGQAKLYLTGEIYTE